MTRKHGPAPQMPRKKRATAAEMAERENARALRRETWRAAIRRVRNHMLARDTLLYGKKRAQELLDAHIAEAMADLPRTRKSKTTEDDVSSVVEAAIAADSVVAEAEKLALGEPLDD